MYWSRWSCSEAVVASLLLAVPSCRLIWAMRAIASLARVTASESPSSASLRSPCTSVVMLLSCWVSTLAELSTLARAEVEPGLVDSASSAPMKLL